MNAGVFDAKPSNGMRVISQLLETTKLSNGNVASKYAYVRSNQVLDDNAYGIVCGYGSDRYTSSQKDLAASLEVSLREGYSTVHVKH